MKKGFISFILISLSVMTSLVIGAVAYEQTHKPFWTTDVKLADDFLWTIYDGRNYNYSNNYLSDLSFNNSHNIVELASFDSTTDKNGFIVSVGSIKNQTLHDHGLLQLIAFDLSGIEPIPDISSYHLDDSINSTKYLECTILANGINTSEDNYPIAVALKQNVLHLEYEFEIFTIVNNDHFELDFTFTIPDNRFESIIGFELFDIDSDGTLELFVIGYDGTITTDAVIVEYSYNYVLGNFEESDEYTWDATDYNYIKCELIEESTKINFIITGMNTASILPTLLAISLNKGITRSFSVEDAEQFNYDSDIFRVYGMRLFTSNTLNLPGIALFGTYIVGANTYACCLKVLYIAGEFQASNIDTFEDSPSWSFDGMIFDIDLDGDDEIMMISYDLLHQDESLYKIYTNQNLIEIDEGSTNLYNVSSSISTKIGSTYISSWVGDSATSRPTIQIFIPHHCPMKIESNSEYLIENSMNNFTINTYHFNGSLVARNDIELSSKLKNEEYFSRNVTGLPNNLSIDVSIIGIAALTEELSFCLATTEIEFQVITISTIVDRAPDIIITFPAEPIVVRDTRSSRIGVTIDIVNLSTQDQTANISITAIISDDVAFISDDMPSEGVGKYTLEIVVMDEHPEGNYIENIFVEIITNGGTYVYEYDVVVFTQYHIVTKDFMNGFYITLAIVIVLLVAYLFVIYRTNRERIRKHIANDDPLNLDIPWFKERAVDALIREYTVAGKWELGIKLSTEFRPKQEPYFHQNRARHYLLEGQSKAYQGKFFDTLADWEKARESIAKLENHQWLDTLDLLLDSLRIITEVRRSKKGDKKTETLLKEFQALSSMREQSKSVLGVELSIPLYLVAEDLGLAYKDTEDLQSSLTYLQFAYQYAPDNLKNRIITEITALIGLGMTPQELAMPIDQKIAQERLAKRTILCYSCGKEKTDAKAACENCGIEAVVCSVCKLPISYGSETLQCHQCENIAHKEHLLEWIKVKGSCPVCQTSLKTGDFVTTDSTE